MKKKGSAPRGLKEARELLDVARAIRTYMGKLHKIRERLAPLALGNDISEKEFYTLAVLLKPRTYHEMLKNYFIAKVGAKKITAGKGEGDLVWDGVHYEYKLSAFNDKKVLHIVRIRLWQKCDYVIQYMDEEHLPPITFTLRHGQMMEELKLCKVSSAHGAMEADSADTNREFRFTIKPGGDHWRRWIENYALAPPRDGELANKATQD